MEGLLRSAKGAKFNSPGQSA